MEIKLTGTADEESAPYTVVDFKGVFLETYDDGFIFRAQPAEYKYFIFADKAETAGLKKGDKIYFKAAVLPADPSFNQAPPFDTSNDLYLKGKIHLR